MTSLVSEVTRPDRCPESSLCDAGRSSERVRARGLYCQREVGHLSEQAIGVTTETIPPRHLSSPCCFEAGCIFKSIA